MTTEKNNIRLTRLSINNLKVAKSAQITEFHDSVYLGEKRIWYIVSVEGNDRRAYLHNKDNDIVLFPSITAASAVIRRHNPKLIYTTI